MPTDNIRAMKNSRSSVTFFKRFASGYYIERKWLRFDLCKEQRTSAKILRVLIGLFVALLIKEGLPLLIGTSILAKSLKYFILVMWVLVIYPCIFNNVLRRNA